MASVSSRSREYQCWCGCGQAIERPHFFAPGHDRWAESYVIRKEYGNIAAFLKAHGYGPHGRSARKEAARSAATSSDQSVPEGVVDEATPLRNSDRAELVNANRHLVFSVASGFLHQGLVLADLVAAGNLGLTLASQNYDSKFEVRFSTYAS